MSLHFQFIVTEEQVNFLLLQQFSKYSISFLFLILEKFRENFVRICEIDKIIYWKVFRFNVN